MLAALRRRGPDAEHAVFWDAGLQRSDAPAPNALLHTRLSIIDPRPLADQPMGNDDGDVWIAYNGEVYDWADDARALEAAGYASGRGPTPSSSCTRTSTGAATAFRACAACSPSRSSTCAGGACSSSATGWA